MVSVVTMLAESNEQKLWVNAGKSNACGNRLFQIYCGSFYDIWAQFYARVILSCAVTLHRYNVRTVVFAAFANKSFESRMFGSLSLSVHLLLCKKWRTAERILMKFGVRGVMLKFIDTFFCQLKSDNINGHFTSTHTTFLIASQK